MVCALSWVRDWPGKSFRHRQGGSGLCTHPRGDAQAPVPGDLVEKFSAHMKRLKAEQLPGVPYRRMNSAIGNHDGISYRAVPYGLNVTRAGLLDALPEGALASKYSLRAVTYRLPFRAG